MSRLVRLADEGWQTIQTKSTTDLEHMSTTRAWALEARLAFSQIAELPEVPDPQEELDQTRTELGKANAELDQTRVDLNLAEEQLAAARAIVERQAARLLDGGDPLGRARPATVPLPEAFEGDPKTYLDFKTKLNNKFRADAPTFRNDQHRLSVAVSLLKKGAADIMRPYMKDNTIDLANVAEYWQVLDRAFDDPDRKGTAERNLKALRQGKKEFAHYFADFMRLKADVEWNDAACIDALRTGCAQEIRDVLRVQLSPLPVTLQEVADLLNKIDLQNRQWAAENNQHKTPNLSGPAPKKPVVSPLVPVSQRTTSNPAWTGPAPMDLSASNRAAARAAARTAKRAKAVAEGLCFTCSSPDHGRANCPVQAQYDQARALRAAATADAPAATGTVSAPKPSEN
jgi:hypothetical protein